MSDGKKKRLSMLDNLAATGAPAPSAPMMTSNRALRSARDAVDSHRVWDLDPAVIEDDRPADRLEFDDVADLIDSIEANGQTVPILVRRKADQTDRFLLVYGRRRLEAIRRSQKVSTIRALVANLDDDTALRSQISENMARRDLSFIEKAMFAQSLVEGGFGNQSKVAEVLTATKSAVSMAISVAETVGQALARAIGPAHGVGRPKWEALARGIKANDIDLDHLIQVANDAKAKVATKKKTDEDTSDSQDISVLAFDAVSRAVAHKSTPELSGPDANKKSSVTLKAAGRNAGVLKRKKGALTIELKAGSFADWVETQAPDLVEELHARWKGRAED